jgi:hypothetical protein
MPLQRRDFLHVSRHIAQQCQQIADVYIRRQQHRQTARMIGLPPRRHAATRPDLREPIARRAKDLRYS